MLGLDLSNHQRAVDWAAIASAGIQFAIAKATEGTSFVDAYYTGNVAGARANGVLPGAYHYGRTENDPDAEAAHFLRVALPALVPGDLIALDIEEASAGADVAAWSRAWLATVAAATGCKPLVYSFPWFIDTHLSDPALADYPLWLASWQAAMPTVPAPWTDYAIWQFTSQGTVAGVAGHADVNRTDRDVAGLQALGLPGLAGTVDPVDAELEREYQRDAARLGVKLYKAIISRPRYSGPVLVAQRGIVGPNAVVTSVIREEMVDDWQTYLTANNVLTRL